MSTLCYGNNLFSLRRYLRDETGDLDYLDPSFHSAKTYNSLFQEKDGTSSLFKAYIHEQPGKLSDLRQAFHVFHRGNGGWAEVQMKIP